MREPTHGIGAVGRGVVRVVRQLPEPIQDEVSTLLEGFLGIVLLLLALVIAIPIFIVTAIPYLAVSSLLGSPSGPLAVILFLAWFVGSLALLFVVMVRIRRAAPNVAGLIEHAVGPDETDSAASRARRDATTAGGSAATNAGSLEERIAAADARLAPPGPEVD